MIGEGRRFPPRPPLLDRTPSPARGVACVEDEGVRGSGIAWKVDCILDLGEGPIATPFDRPLARVRDECPLVNLNGFEDCESREGAPWRMIRLPFSLSPSRVNDPDAGKDRLLRLPKNAHKRHATKWVRWKPRKQCHPYIICMKEG